MTKRNGALLRKTRTERGLVAALALWFAAPVSAAPADLVPASGAWVKISTAELQARYDTLWAVSDVHGRIEQLERLLVASRLAVRRGTELAWNPEQRRVLFVVAGDLIDGGPDSVGVVLLVERLQREAAAAGSRIVVVLGNHEAELLARPGSASPELLASAARHAAELGLPPRFKPKRLEATRFAEYLRDLPVAAFVGSWLFAHAGYIDADDGEPGLRAWIARVDEAVAPRDRRAFAALLDRRSIVASHDWWKSRRRLAETRARLRALGLSGLLFGHDPEALGLDDAVGMNREGWLIKLDAGLKSGGSDGMLLRCEVRDIVSAEALLMVRDGAPTCRAATPDGALRALPVR
jgi:hypothetical protein